jgi:hypothetical protein
MRKSSLASRLVRSLPDRRAARLVELHRASSLAAAPAQEIGSAISRLEGLLERYSPLALLSRDSRASRELRTAVRAIALEARLEDPVRCERLLLTLRCAWRDFPQIRSLADQPVRDALWSRLVRLCCEEFYGPRRRLTVVE